MVPVSDTACNFCGLPGSPSSEHRLKYSVYQQLGPKPRKLWHLAGRAKRETAKARNRTRNAHFRRFLLIFGSLCKSRDLGVADLRRKPQETADFCAEAGFSHLLSPFWRAPRIFPIRTPKTLENPARGEFHLNFTANFTTPLAEKKGEHVHSAHLQGGCCDIVLDPGKTKLTKGQQLKGKIVS